MNKQKTQKQETLRELRENFQNLWLTPLLPLPGPSSSSQPKKKKATKDDNEGVDIRKFFVAKEKVSNYQEKEKNDILEISNSNSD